MRLYWKITIVIAIILLLLMCVGGAFWIWRSSPKTSKVDVSDKLCNEWFNDRNKRQLGAAKTVGLKQPLKSREELDGVMSQLVKISATESYKIDKLTHSVPYLTPGGKRLLDMLGKEFTKNLEQRSLGSYRFIVTSVLRTDEDVRGLQKSGNVNASKTSAHCYATTFDITYVRFDETGGVLSNKASKSELKRALMDALRKLQLEGKCYVKYEVKQKCFHITTRMK
jgi:hypothetical protein